MSIVANTLETLALGGPVIHENLAMFPLLGGKLLAAASREPNLAVVAPSES